MFENDYNKRRYFVEKSDECILFENRVQQQLNKT